MQVGILNYFSLANCIIVLSVIVAFLASFDLLTSPNQKAAIANQTLKLWNWLDESKRLSFLQVLRRRRTRIMLSAAAAVILATWLVVTSIHDNLLDFSAIVFIFAGCCIVSALIYLTVTFTLTPQSLTGIFVRATLILLVAIAPIIHQRYFPMGEQLSVLYVHFRTGELLAILAASVFVFFWLWVAVPLLFIFLITCTLIVGEFIIRRIAEYPKGVILAASILLGTVAAILKAVS